MLRYAKARTACSKGKSCPDVRCCSKSLETVVPEDTLTVKRRRLTAQDSPERYGHVPGNAGTDCPQLVIGPNEPSELDWNCISSAVGDELDTYFKTFKIDADIIPTNGHAPIRVHAERYGRMDE